MNLADKVAVITGGASGIGRAIGDALRLRGAKVAVLDSNEERLADVRLHAPEVLALSADVTDPANLESANDRILDHFGEVHIVCANAGVSGRASSRLWDETELDWRWIVDVNLIGTVNTLRAFVPSIVSQDEGHVVLTASMAAVTTGASQAGYWATKHAILSIAETLQLQLQEANPGVSASVLLPGGVSTNLGESRLGDTPRGFGVPGWDPLRLDAQTVADLVVSAIAERRFYVFTHPDAASRVRLRTDELLAAADDFAATARRTEQDET
jgi:NADP-dependent 3-hydroxy acid dehydrogenase YdfG